MSIKNRLNKYLRKLHVEIHGLGYLQSLSKNEFKSSEYDFFTKLFNQNDKINIYDIGANQGLMIRKFLSLFPNANIHAFEPYQPYANQLVSDFEMNQNIKVNSCGISNYVGEQLLNVNKSIDTSSFLSSKKTGLNSDTQVETISQMKVPISNIDHYLQHQEYQHINILKIDIQGSELDALKGAEEALKSKKIDVIFSEAYFVQQYENQPLFADIVKYLTEVGYVIQDIYNPIYGKSKLAWCDVMFIRNDLTI